MARRTLPVFLSAAGATALTFGLLTAAAASSQAASCPTVDPTTGAVTPAPAPGVVWSGCYLNNADLAGADLTGANLTDSDLAGADLAGATATNALLIGSALTDVNLTDADLLGAQLNDADIAGSDVDGANMTDSIVTGLISGDVTGTPADYPYQWFAVSGYLLGPGANASGAKLPGVSLPGALLASIDFDNADLQGADLDGAVLSEAQLGANFTGANLQGASLGGSEFGGGNLTDADLSDAVLAGASLAANLTDANLTDVNLEGGSLKGATVNGMILAGASLAGATVGPVLGTAASLPANWTQVQSYLVGPGAYLSQDDLAGYDLAGLDLSGANFLQATLDNADLKAAELSDADLDQASIQNADLQDADLTSADLDEAALGGADLSGATITGASLANVVWGNTICPDGSNSDAHVPDGCTTPLDTSPPVAAPAVSSGSPGASGWYTSPVTVDWHWTDNGVVNPADCTQSTTSSEEGPQTLTASCADVAGNVGHASFAVKVDTSGPAVTVTGVVAGQRYFYGAVPAAGCTTTDDVSGVATDATVTVAPTPSGGVGAMTATCAGATSQAGNEQAAPVSVSYQVVYGIDGFISPRSGQTLARTRSLDVRFRLTDAGGKALPRSLAAQLAARHDVRVTLTGPGIKAVIATCKWSPSGGDFVCAVKVPARVKTGKSRHYLVTAQEAAGHGFIAVPAVHGAADTVTIHFSS